MYRCFFRICPPHADTLVSTFSKSIDDENINDFDDSNSIETTYSDDNTNEPPKMYTKIRICQSLHSNTAKVVRRGSNHLMESLSKNSTTGLTGTDEKSNNTEDGLVNEVTEYVLNRVFTPAVSQADVYNSIAAPMVDGLFPSINNG